MTFVVIASDGSDVDAPARRQAAREAHLRVARDMFDQGPWLYAAGIQNDDGQVVGSMIVCDYPSRDELERLWLNHEPYVVDRVWERIDIHRAEVAQFADK